MVSRITMKSKRAQEEIVGFAMIVIIVSIILIFFLVFSLSDEPETASYEAESFLQSSLHYTSGCADNGEFLSVQELMVSCYNEERCDNEADACSVLNETLAGILKESWSVGSNFPVKGYKIEISSGEEKILSIREGNITGSYKGAQQPLPYAGAQISVLFNVYS
ncbi:MAG: hypothetical protein Q8P79_03735 [Nanoarchaeota archaeon]|nr:hypothetical protein [Nanoarchaeota archaeon]